MSLSRCCSLAPLTQPTHTRTPSPPASAASMQVGSPDRPRSSHVERTGVPGVTPAPMCFANLRLLSPLQVVISGIAALRLLTYRHTSAKPAAAFALQVIPHNRLLIDFIPHPGPHSGCGMSNHTHLQPRSLGVV